MLGMYVADLVGDDGEGFLVVEPLDEGGVKNDDRLLNTACECIDDRVLLDKHVRHLDLERLTGDLELCIKVRALLWRHLYCACGKHHPYRRFARPLEQLLQRAVHTGNSLERGHRLGI